MWIKIRGVNVDSDKIIAFGTEYDKERDLYHLYLDGGHKSWIGSDDIYKLEKFFNTRPIEDVLKSCAFDNVDDMIQDLNKGL